MRLEHANIIVNSLHESQLFISTALPLWSVRGSGESGSGQAHKRWLHIGDEDSYITLNQMSSVQWVSSCRESLAHLGIEVSDLAALTQRLLDAGYLLEVIGAPHPYRKSAYFRDPNDVQYEFIEYLSERSEERNLYGGETGEIEIIQRRKEPAEISLTRRLYQAVDELDAPTVGRLLEAQVYFRLANYPAIEGREAVIEANAQFFTSIQAMNHRLESITCMNERVVCSGFVSYQRLDGTRLNDIPFSTTLHFSAQKITNYLVYVDISQL